MADLIDRVNAIKLLRGEAVGKYPLSFYVGLFAASDELNKIPTVDAVEVVRCKACIHYHKAHVLCPDGTEKDFSEFPHEELDPFGFVSLKHGINVGGMCEFEKNCGYDVDKSVYRNPDDFCSRGRTKGR